MKTKKHAKKFQPAAWQLDPASLTSERVQVWSRDGILMCLVSLESARESVRGGHMFAGSAQHICQF